MGHLRPLHCFSPFSRVVTEFKRQHLIPTQAARRPWLKQRQHLPPYRTHLAHAPTLLRSTLMARSSLRRCAGGGFLFHPKPPRSSGRAACSDSRLRTDPTANKSASRLSPPRLGRIVQASDAVWRPLYWHGPLAQALAPPHRLKEFLISSCAST